MIQSAIGALTMAQGSANFEKLPLAWGDSTNAGPQRDNPISCGLIETELAFQIHRFRSKGLGFICWKPFNFPPKQESQLDQLTLVHGVDKTPGPDVFAVETLQEKDPVHLREVCKATPSQSNLRLRWVWVKIDPPGDRRF